MGWWSTDVLGGDDPLDVCSELDRRLGLGDDADIDAVADVWVYPLEAWTDEERQVIHDRFVAQRDDLFARAREWPIAGQVIGVVALAAGVQLTAEEQATVIAAAHADEWASVDDERAAEMAKLVTAIATADGTPNVWAHTGLFDTIANHLAGT